MDAPTPPPIILGLDGKLQTPKTPNIKPAAAAAVAPAAAAKTDPAPAAPNTAALLGDIRAAGLGKLKKVDASLIKDSSAPVVPGSSHSVSKGPPAAADAAPGGKKGFLSVQEEMAAKLAAKLAQKKEATTPAKAPTKAPITPAKAAPIIATPITTTPVKAAKLAKAPTAPIIATAASDKGPDASDSSSTKAPVLEAKAPLSSPPASLPTGPGYVAQLFIEWKGKGQTAEKQCEQIFSAVNCLIKKGYKHIGLTYSANQNQTQAIFRAYNYHPNKEDNNFDNDKPKTIQQIPIEGGQQATTLGRLEGDKRLPYLDKFTEDQTNPDNVKFRKAFRVIPFSTIRHSGSGGSGQDLDENALGNHNDCIKYASDFLKLENSIILGWCSYENDVLSNHNNEDLADIGYRNNLVDSLYTLSSQYPSSENLNLKLKEGIQLERKKNFNIGGVAAENTDNTRTTYIPEYLKFLVRNWNAEAQQVVNVCKSSASSDTASKTASSLDSTDTASNKAEVAAALAELSNPTSLIGKPAFTISGATGEFKDMINQQFNYQSYDNTTETFSYISNFGNNIVVTFSNIGSQWEIKRTTGAVLAKSICIINKDTKEKGKTPDKCISNNWSEFERKGEPPMPGFKNATLNFTIITHPKDAPLSPPVTTTASEDASEGAVITDKITGYYKSKSGQGIYFTASKKTLPNGTKECDIVLFGLFSKGIADTFGQKSQFNGVVQTINITEEEFDKFKTTITGKLNAVWKTMIDGVEKEVPGTWTKDPYTCSTGVTNIIPGSIGNYQTKDYKSHDKIFGYGKLMAFDRDGNIVAADEYDDCLKVIDPTSLKVTKTIGEKGSGPGQFDCPNDVAFDDSGNIIVVDTNNHRIQVLSYPNGNHIRTIGKKGSGQGEFDEPTGVAVDMNGLMYVYDGLHNSRVQVLRISDGSFIGSLCNKNGKNNGELAEKGIGSVTLDNVGNIVVTDTGNKRVQIFDCRTGDFIRSIVINNPTNSRPTSVAFDNSGKIIVVDANNNKLKIFNYSDGNFIRNIDININSDEPCGVLVDNNGKIFVSCSTDIVSFELSHNKPHDEIEGTTLTPLSFPQTTSPQSFVEVLNTILLTNKFGSAVDDPEIKCNTDNANLKLENPTLDTLLNEFYRPSSTTDKDLFMHAYHFCRNMKNSFDILTPTKNDLLKKMRKNCFLLTCGNIEKSVGAVLDEDPIPPVPPQIQPRPAPAPAPTSTAAPGSPDQSLQQMIEYYSQDGGATPDEKARFAELNIEKYPIMNWELTYQDQVYKDNTYKKDVTSIDRRFTKGIDCSLSNMCYFNTALQFLLCNQDFIQLLIEGNCKDNFVSSLKLFKHNEEYKKKYRKSDCSSDDFENSKKILDALLNFFNTWIKSSTLDKTALTPIIRDLILDSKITTEETISEQQDSAEMIGKIYDPLLCIDSEYTNKFLKNLTFDYTEKLSAPYDIKNKPLQFIPAQDEEGNDKVKIEKKTSLEIKPPLDFILDENFIAKSFEQSFTISEVIRNEKEKGQDSKFNNTLVDGSVLKNNYNIIISCKRWLGPLKVVVDKNATTQTKGSEIKKFNDMRKDEEFKNFIAKNKNKGVFTDTDFTTDVFSNLEKIHINFSKSPITSAEDVIKYNNSNNNIITDTYKNIDNIEDSILSPPGIYYTKKSEITEVNKYLLITFNRLVLIKTTGKPAKNFIEIIIEPKLTISNKEFVLQGYSLHLGEVGGHYVFVKCNTETGIEELVLDDEHIYSVEELDKARTALLAPLPIFPQDVRPRNVVAFIYKQVGEEPSVPIPEPMQPSTPAAPVAASTTANADTIKGYIREAIGDTDKASEYDSDSSDGGGVKYYRKNNPKCKSSKQRVIKLDDPFLVKAHAIAKCYTPECYFPAWVCMVDKETEITECFASAKVYYDAGDDLKQVVTLATQREPTNIGGNKNYIRDNLECMFGYSESPYSQQNYSNIAVYTKTPYYTFADDYSPRYNYKNIDQMGNILNSNPLTENLKPNPNYPFMHIVHAYAPAFDSNSQPDFKRYKALNDQGDPTKAKAKEEYKKDIEKMLRKIRKSYSDFKQNRPKARLILTGIGQSAFAVMCFSILGGTGAQECNNIFYECVKEFFKNDKSVFYNQYAPGQSGISDPLDVSQVLFGINYIQEFVISKDNKDKLGLTEGELSDNILWVNAWDPFSMLGNANYVDPSTDGYFGRKTAIAVIGWPVTNPDIQFIAVATSNEPDTPAAPGAAPAPEDAAEAKAAAPAGGPPPPPIINRFPPIGATDEQITSWLNKSDPSVSMEDKYKFVKNNKKILNAWVASMDAPTKNSFDLVAEDYTPPKGDAAASVKKAPATAAATAAATASVKKADAKIPIPSVTTADIAAAASNLRKTPDTPYTKEKVAVVEEITDESERAKKYYESNSTWPADYHPDEFDTEWAEALKQKADAIRKGDNIKANKDKSEIKSKLQSADDIPSSKQGVTDIAGNLETEVKHFIKTNAFLQEEERVEKAKKYYTDLDCDNPEKVNDKNCIDLKPLQLTEEEKEWGGGGHIKKKLLRKQQYRNLNDVDNKTSRKKTKLTEVFKSKKNNRKTLRSK